MTYDAIIFDNDGVLTTPTRRDVLTAAIEATLRDFGVSDPDPDHFERLISLGVETLEEICAGYDLDPETFWPARDQKMTQAHQREISEGRKVCYDDVELLHELDVAMGIVSNNQHTTIEYLVEFFEFEELFVTYYGRELTLQGLERKKPNPYYLERAIEDLGAERPLYVGDSRSDIEVAVRLGIDSVFVRRPHRESYSVAPQPTYEIDSFEELEAILEG